MKSKIVNADFVSFAFQHRGQVSQSQRRIAIHHLIPFGRNERYSHD